MPNIKTLGFKVSDKKIFSHYSYKSLCKTCDPRAGPHGYNLNNLYRGLLGDATYQIAIV